MDFCIDIFIGSEPEARHMNLPCDEYSFNYYLNACSEVYGNLVSSFSDEYGYCTRFYSLIDDHLYFRGAVYTDDGSVYELKGISS